MMKKPFATICLSNGARANRFCLRYPSLNFKQITNHMIEGYRNTGRKKNIYTWDSERKKV